MGPAYAFFLIWCLDRAPTTIEALEGTFDEQIRAGLEHGLIVTAGDCS
jgi:hypothetical protein